MRKTKLHSAVFCAAPSQSLMVAVKVLPGVSDQPPQSKAVGFFNIGHLQSEVYSQDGALGPSRGTNKTDRARSATACHLTSQRTAVPSSLGAETWQKTGQRLQLQALCFTAHSEPKEGIQ